jgi:hypothetical protein
MLFCAVESLCETIEQVINLHLENFEKTIMKAYLLFCTRISILSPRTVSFTLQCRLHGAKVYEPESLVSVIFRARGEANSRQIGRYRAPRIRFRRQYLLRQM